MVWQRATKGMQQTPKQCEVHRFVQAGLVLPPNVQIVNISHLNHAFYLLCLYFSKIPFSWAEAYIQWHLYKGQPKAAVISALSWLEFWCHNFHDDQGKRAGGRERKEQGPSVCVK